MSAAAKSAYAPAPGTTAYRALAHLESLMPGAELMTSALAEAIGVAPLNVGPCLEAALKHGLVFRRQRDNHVRSPFWWSLVDHSNQPRQDIRRPAVPDVQDPYGVPCGFVPRDPAKDDSGVAQTVERRVHTPEVGGANPGSPDFHVETSMMVYSLKTD